MEGSIRQFEGFPTEARIYDRKETFLKTTIKHCLDQRHEVLRLRKVVAAARTENPSEATAILKLYGLTAEKLAEREACVVRSLLGSESMSFAKATHRLKGCESALNNLAELRGNDKLPAGAFATCPLARKSGPADPYEEKSLRKCLSRLEKSLVELSVDMKVLTTPWQKGTVRVRVAIKFPQTNA